MKVEIWSDIVCPFCYIGKRNLEKALLQTDMLHSTEILWRSFELDPEAATNPELSIYEHLANRKGWTLEHSREMHGHVVNMAKEAGLEYRFDSTFPVNSLNAHRLLHLARKSEVQNKLKELLFKAHFTEGKNVDDFTTLTGLGLQAGLNKDEIEQTLNGSRFTEDVRKDIARAQEAGVKGVPYFVFDEHYAVAGAQQPDVLIRIIDEIKSKSAKKRGEETQEKNDFCKPDRSG